MGEEAVGELGVEPVELRDERPALGECDANIIELPL
jgi:hypothetical protein